MKSRHFLINSYRTGLLTSSCMKILIQQLFNIFSHYCHNTTVLLKKKIRRYQLPLPLEILKIPAMLI